MTTSTMVAPRFCVSKTRCFFRHFSPTLRRGDDNWANFARRRASCASLSIPLVEAAVFIKDDVCDDDKDDFFFSGKRHTLSPKGIKSSLLSKGVEEEKEDRH
jgi:hypothetical protein